MTGFTLFTDLFSTIDEVTMTYVTEISAKATAAITPVVVVGLTLALIVHGLLVVRGLVQSPVMEFLGRSLRIGVVVGIALTSGLYQGDIASAIRDTPDALASALSTDTSGTGAQAASLIDQAAGEGFDRAGEAWEQGNVFSEDGFLYFGIGFVYVLATMIVVAIGGAFILLAKIGLAVLAGLGPIFIVGLLWQPTQRFFDVWIGQVANYTLLVVLSAVTFGLMLNLYSGFMEGVTFDDTANLAYNVGAVCILSVAMVVVLLQLPSLASALAGGVAMAYLYEMRAIQSGASAARRAVGGAGRGAVAGAHGAATTGRQLAAGAPAGDALAAGRARAAGYFKGKKAA